MYNFRYVSKKEASPVKASQSYSWVEQGKGYYKLPKKIEFLKK